MNVAKITEIPARRFFGLEPSQNFMQMGLPNLMKLMEAMQKKLGFVKFAQVKDNNYSVLFSKEGWAPKNLTEFKEKGLAVITLRNPEFAHTATQCYNTHTIGLAINKSHNQHFYPTEPEILILDSCGNSYPGAKEIHGALTRDFIKRLFPDSRVIVTPTPQQIDSSATCLNWTLANLQTVKENMGRADILNLLPKSSDLPRILEEQQQFVQNQRGSF